MIFWLTGRFINDIEIDVYQYKVACNTEAWQKCENEPTIKHTETLKKSDAKWIRIIRIKLCKFKINNNLQTLSHHGQQQTDT